MTAVAHNQPASFPESASDAELVARALAGDSWSRDLLYRRHAPYLLWVSTRLLSNPNEREDVVQDTFIILFEQLSKLREPGSLRSWLAHVAANKVRRRLRRANFLQLLALDQEQDDATLTALAEPSLASDDRTELWLIDTALRRVPTDQRLAWMLRRVEGLSLAEVASMCDCSLSTAKRRIAAVDAVMARHVSVDPLLTKATRRGIRGCHAPP